MINANITNTKIKITYNQSNSNYCYKTYTWSTIVQLKTNREAYLRFLCIKHTFQHAPRMCANIHAESSFCFCSF